MDYEITTQDTMRLPELLTHRNAAGETYQRLKVVDRQIKHALMLDSEELQRRSEVRDKEVPEFLKEECLVYLIRHYHKAGDRQRVNDLSESLVRRCGNWVHRGLLSLGQELANEGYSDALERLFEQVLDLNSDRGDFLQVRFWFAMEKIRVQSFRKQLNKLKLEQDNISRAGFAGRDGEDTDGLTRRHAELVLSANSHTVESEVIEKTMIREALNRLEEPIRSVFFLRHHYGMPIENQYPAVQTISQHFKKTPRTIRNWLAKAEKCLATWRGEQE